MPSSIAYLEDNKCLVVQIVLDQPSLMGVHVLWESQLEYHACHNDWEEVIKLLDVIPTSVLTDGSIQISLDGLQPASTVICNSEFSNCGNYICSIEELHAVCLDIPNIRIFRLPADLMCSIWLRTLMEEELAKKFIFLKEYWEGTAEIITLLARSGFITNSSNLPHEDNSENRFTNMKLSNIIGRSTVDTVHGLHKLFIHHCAQHNLPNLLDLYLDHHKLVLDSDSLYSLQEATVSFCPMNIIILCISLFFVLVENLAVFILAVHRLFRVIVTGQDGCSIRG